MEHPYERTNYWPNDRPMSIVVVSTPFRTPIPSHGSRSRQYVPSPFPHLLAIPSTDLSPDSAPSPLVPPGVLSILTGGPTVAKALVAHPLIRHVDITAGTSTGRAVGAVVGANLAGFTAELGGKAPIVVFDDADMESAINGVAFAAFVASGQTCVSGTRLILHEGVYEWFMEGLRKKVEGIERRIGDREFLLHSWLGLGLGLLRMVGMMGLG